MFDGFVPERFDSMIEHSARRREEAEIRACADNKNQLQYNLDAEGDKAMQNSQNGFDMVKTGNAISVLRKRAGLTQAELADKLSISYQAVSSWERGMSMPDIGKLLDLARLLNVSVDCILSGEIDETEKPEVAPVVQTAQAEGEAIESVSPIVPIEIGGNDESDAEGESYEQAAPADDKADETNKYQGKAFTSNPFRGLKLVSLAPFMKKSDLEELVENSDPKDVNLVALAPFLSSEFLVRMLRERGPADKSLLKKLAPFINKDALGSIVKDAFADKSAESDGENESNPNVYIGINSADSEHIKASVIDALVNNMDSGKLTQALPKLKHSLSDKQIMRLIENADDEDLPEIAGVLSDMLNDKHISRLIDCLDSEDLPKLCFMLCDKLSSKHILRIIETADSEDLKRIAVILAEKMNDEHISALIKNADQDDLPEIAEILAHKLNDEHISLIISSADCEDLPKLALSLKDKISNEGISLIIANADCDDLIRIAEIFGGRLNGEHISALISNADRDDLPKLAKMLDLNALPNKMNEALSRLMEED